MTTEQIQKSYVDYRNLGDTGEDASSSVQPVQTNEAALPIVTNRPTENIRSRTEIARSVLDDLLYYRDCAYPYHISLAGSGVLSWAGTVALGGTGILDATTALTLRPMLTAHTKKLCELVTGVNGVNEVIYGEPSSPDATHGTNQFTIEHRDVPGTVTLTAAVTEGPIYRIIVVFDSTNPAHDAATAAAAVNALMAPPLPPFGATGFDTGTAIATLAETPIDIREHAIGTSGRANLQAEAHTLLANAISAFTTATPLVEGDVLAIRYDYVIEPDAGDPDDPKAGVPGGRAESSIARGNSDVAANLFILGSKPEWAPGAIPLCKIVNNVARWIDGTNVVAGGTATPGASTSVVIDASGFQGAPTLVVGGGLLGTDTTPQAVADTTDRRLGQLRTVTRTCSATPSSTGGFYDGGTAVQDALDEISGATTGGHIYVRKALNYFAIDGSFVNDDLLIEGEDRDNTQIAVVNAVFGSCGFTGSTTLRRLTLRRASGAALGFSGEMHIEDCVVDSGLIAFFAATERACLRNVVFEATSQATGPLTEGIILAGKEVYADQCVFVGPDQLVTGSSGVARISAEIGTITNSRFLSVGTDSSTVFAGGVGDNCRLVFRNCTFDVTVSTTAYVLEQSGGGAANITYDNCTFRNLSNGALLANIDLNAGQHITFNECIFVQETATPSAATQAVFVVDGGTNSSVSMRNCKIITLGSVDTGATFPLIVLGGDAAGSTAGGVRLDIDGLTIECVNAATSRLHSGSTVVMLQNADGTSRMNNVYVKCGGLRKHAGSNYIARAWGYSNERPLYLDNFTMDGVDYNDAVIASGILDFRKVHAQGLTVRADASVDVAGYFSAIVYVLLDNRILGAELPLFRADQGAGAYAVSMDVVAALGDRAMFQGIFSEYVAGDATKLAQVLVGRAMVFDTRFPQKPVPAGTGAIKLSGGASIHDCVLYIPDNETVGIDFDSTDGNDVQSNTLVFDNNGAFSTAFDNVSNNYNIVVGNRVLNLQTDVPGLPAGGGTTVVANNVAAGTVTVY